MSPDTAWRARSHMIDRSHDRQKEGTQSHDRQEGTQSHDRQEGTQSHDRQTDRQTDNRQTDRQTDRQTHKHTDMVIMKYLNKKDRVINGQP